MVLSVLFSTSFAAHAATIPLYPTWTPEPAPNRAPPFYVWQNDPALTEFLRSDGTTPVCVPSAISNAMVYQYSYKKNPANQLRLPGMSADGKSIDSNTLIRHFAKICKEYDGGYDIYDAGECIRATYQNSGYANSKIKVIRGQLQDRSNTLETVDRAPTIADLKTALAEGYEVIASFAMMRFDSQKGEWVKQSGHAVNIYGVKDNVLFVSNPSRKYRMNFIDPLFDIVTFKPSAPGTPAPGIYAPIEVTGRILNFPNQTTFLSGLLIFKAQ